MSKRIMFSILLLIALLLTSCGESKDDISPSPTSISSSPTHQPTATAPPEVEPEESVKPTEAPVVPEGPISPMVISEVLTGVDGNNNFDFIELYNTSDLPLDLDGWSLWYQRTEGDEEMILYQWDVLTLVAPHGHYLLTRAGQDFGISSDAVFDQPLAATKGGLNLRSKEEVTFDSLVWGGGPPAYVEGSAAAAMQNGVSLERAPGGGEGNGYDTDDNSADFRLNNTPNPQNSGSLPTPGIADRLQVLLDGPATAEPGGQYDYALSVTNNTGQAIHEVTFEFPIPIGLSVIASADDVEITRGDSLELIGGVEVNPEVAFWRLDSLGAGETKTTQITVGTPWTYLTALATNYYVRAGDWPVPAFGGPVRTNIEGGAIPIGIAQTLVGADMVIEGTATMYTGGYFAGSGNTKFYIEDETGGMLVWVPGGDGEVNVSLGARVRVSGMLDVYRGAFEFITYTPEDVEILAAPSEDSLWDPTQVSLVEAAFEVEGLPGRLLQVEGTVTRAEEFSYSYELDLMDEGGQILTLYVDKLTNMGIETIVTGQKYRATGILEVRDTLQLLYPRIQSDLTLIYPPVLMMEVDAPNTIQTGEVFTVKLMATNHTSDSMTDLIITNKLPTWGIQVDEILDGGTESGGVITWNVPQLAGEGTSVSVGFQAHTVAMDGYLVIDEYQATAAEWSQPARGLPHYVFLGGSVPIWAIQGSGSRSPYVLDPVKTAGVVTAIFPELGGVWIQERRTDSDPMTSAGIFVNSGELEVPVLPGDYVEVSGIVREAFQQTQIQISGPEDVQVVYQGDLFPPAVELDPPFANLEAAEYFEALEGMLVQVTGPARAVAPTSRYGEYVVVQSQHEVERLWQGEENGIAIMVDDGSSEVHIDRSALDYVVTTGDQVSGLVGPLAYTFGSYKIEPIALPQVVISDTYMPILFPTDSSEFSLMTWNVENLFDVRDPHPSSPPMSSVAEYRLALTKIANTILDAGIPTVVGLQEVENFAILEDLVNHDYLFDYGYIPVLEEGTDSRGIDNGFLVRGEFASVVDVQQHVAPEGLTSRPPLSIKVEVATDLGLVTLYVVNNHFTSMSGGEAATEPRRNAQAAWNVAVLEEILADDPGAYVAILGDLNSYYDSPPIDTLRAGGLQHVFDTIPAEERYTYIYQGQSQTLDHILVTPSLMDLLFRVEVLHVNADYPPPEPDDSSPMRKSDHDPVIATFTLEP